MIHDKVIEKNHKQPKFRSHSAWRDKTGQEPLRLPKTLTVSEWHTVQAGVMVVCYMLGLTMKLYFGVRT